MRISFWKLEIKRPTRTRSEVIFSKEMVFDWIDKYVKELWNGLLKRLQHFDSGGTALHGVKHLQKAFFQFSKTSVIIKVV